jgi:hypothetical protein
MNKFLLLTLSATGVFAAASNAFLPERAVYQVPCADQGKKDCGSGCIDASWTCCPDGAGGCPSDASCYLGTNGEYGCCPDGESCAGDGGATTNAYTNTIYGPGKTSTVYGESTLTTQGYEKPPKETESVPVYTSTAAVETITTPVEETTPGSPEQPSYSFSEPETLQTETQTYAQPTTTAGPIIPTSAGYGNNGTVPVQTTPAATPPIVNGAASYGVNVVGGLLAGVAALLI